MYSNVVVQMALGQEVVSLDSYTSAPVDLAAGGTDLVMIASPGEGKQLYIYGLFMMADTAAGTVILADTAGTALTGTMAVSDEGGWVLPISGNFAMPWFKLPEDEGLIACTGACTIDGVVVYGVVDV